MTDNVHKISPALVRDPSLIPRARSAGYIADKNDNNEPQERTVFIDSAGSKFYFDSEQSTQGPSTISVESDEGCNYLYSVWTTM